MRELRLTGMLNALELQMGQAAIQSLPFEDRLGMLVDAEVSTRDTKRMTKLQKDAKLKEPSACIEGIDYDPGRALDRSLINSLAMCNWVEVGQHVIITGATGAGKSWLACAFGTQLCRRGMLVRYFRLSRLIEDLVVAKGDGSLARLRAQLVRASVIILDDWLMAPMDAVSAREIQPGLPQLRIHHQSSSSSSSGTTKPSSAARNSSDVAASSRLVLMLVLMDLSSRMRLSAMWRTSARLWAMCPMRPRA